MLARFASPLIATILAFALGASTAVAWRFGFDPSLGPPLFGRFYSPLAVLQWWSAWGHAPPYRTMFLQGLGLALVPIALGIAVVAAQAVVGGNLGHRRQGRDERDEAGLGKPADLLKSPRVKKTGAGVVLGGHGRDILRECSDGHVLIQGPSRMGKGRTHVIPTLLTYDRAVLVHDAKGELYEQTGARRAQLGPTFVWDPTNPNSHRINPLLELGLSGNLIGDCQAVARLIASAATGDRDPFWREAASSLIETALVQACVTGTPTFSRVWLLLRRAIAGKFPQPANLFVQEGLERHGRREDRLRSSVDETLLASVAWLNDPVIQRVTDGSDVRSVDLQCSDAPTSLFLAISNTQPERLHALTRIVVQRLLRPLLESQTYTADGRRKRHELLLAFDEFPRLGHLDFLERDLAVCAGAGIRAMLVAQDEQDIERIYGDHQSITANCSTHCIIPPKSAKTLASMRAWAGETLVSVSSRQRQPGKLMLPSAGESETQTSVLNTREMNRRSEEEVLVFLAGRHPTWLRKLQPWKHPSLRQYLDLSDDQARGPRIMDEPKPEMVVDLFLTRAELTELEKAAGRATASAYVRRLVLEALEGGPPSATPLIEAQWKDKDLAWQEATFLEVAALNAGKLRNHVLDSSEDGGGGVGPSTALLATIAAAGAATSLMILAYYGWWNATAMLVLTILTLILFIAVGWDWGIYRGRQRSDAGAAESTVAFKMGAAREAVEKHAHELAARDKLDLSEARALAWHERIFEELAAHSEFASPKERYRALERAAARRAMLTVDIDKAVNEKHGASHDVWTKMTFGQGDKSGKGEGLAMGG